MYRLTVDASTDLDSILDDNPELGTEVEHIRPDYLCFQHRSHLIFFKKRKEGILIVRLLHANMDAPRHFN